MSKTKTKTETETEVDILQGKSYFNFINAIKSPATKKGYNNSLKRYLSHLKLKQVDDLLLHSINPWLIESQIIDYIMALRNDGVSYATIQFLIAPIFTFYMLNDVVLNKKKVSRYVGEYRRIVRDQAYSMEQIQTALQTADSRSPTAYMLIGGILYTILTR